VFPEVGALETRQLRHRAARYAEGSGQETRSKSILAGLPLASPLLVGRSPGSQDNAGFV
jgi:hypothetical protein